MSTQAPVSFPLSAPTLNGNEITIDLLLNQPLRITRVISDLAQQRFISDYFFTAGSSTSGGAVVYDQATENELYLSRDVQIVSPAGDFPLVTSERNAPKIAPVEKWGGKFFYADEAKDRNDQAAFRNQVTRLTNTIIRKHNQRAMEVVRQSIAASGQTFVGNNWAAYQPGGTTPTLPGASPWADISKGIMLADTMELGVSYDTLLVNPQQNTALKNARLTAADLGLTTIFPSNRVPAGRAYLVEKGTFGAISIEQPLRTVTWYEEARERTWVKSSERDVMYATNPFAVVEITGLAG